MEKDWERCIPFFSINKEVADLLLKSYRKDLKVKSITRMKEGCRNTNYALEVEGLNHKLLLRIFNEDDESYKRERNLLQKIEDIIPVQEVYYIGKHELIENRTFGIYKFIEGCSLREYVLKENEISKEFICDIARVLAVLHNNSYESIGFLDDNLKVHEKLPPLESWYEMFLGERARKRLGEDVSEKIIKLVEDKKDFLKELDTASCLVHGDFQGANILIKDHRLICVLDWEFSMAGHRLADIAQFFRYEEYFNEKLLREFEREYNKYANIQLEKEWYNLGKLRDLATLVQMIGTKEDLPEKYKDLKKLIEGYLSSLI